MLRLKPQNKIFPKANRIKFKDFKINYKNLDNKETNYSKKFNKNKKMSNQTIKETN